MAEDGAGQGSAPILQLDGYQGPLDMLLAAARAHEIDLARVSLRALVEQLVDALQSAVPVERKAEWISIGAWLLLLRSRLLLPEKAPEHRAAASKADQLRDRLRDLQEAQAGAAWLETRPQLGRDVFPRGCPELLGLAEETSWEIDIIEFLWAGMALFDDGSDAGLLEPDYAPVRPDLHSIADAHERILHRLREAGGPLPLGALLPEPESGDDASEPTSRRRSRWTSTFVAGLELAKQQLVGIDQEMPFHTGPILEPRASDRTADRSIE